MPTIACSGVVTSKTSKLAMISVVIPARNAAGTIGAALGSLAGKKYWPIDMAYFDGSNEGGEETPEVRISFKLYDDGFQRDFFWDYGDFSLAGKLVNVTMLEPSGNCQNQ